MLQLLIQFIKANGLLYLTEAALPILLVTILFTLFPLIGLYFIYAFFALLLIYWFNEEIVVLVIQPKPHVFFPSNYAHMVAGIVLGTLILTILFNVFGPNVPCLNIPGMTILNGACTQIATTTTLTTTIRSNSTTIPCNGLYCAFQGSTTFPTSITASTTTIYPTPNNIVVKQPPGALVALALAFFAINLIELILFIVIRIVLKLR